MERPSWAFSDQAIIFKYYEDSARRVFVLEGLDHHFDILPLFTQKDHCLISIPCHTTDWNFKFARKCLESQNPRYSPLNITFLANTMEQKRQAIASGFESIYFNQNALLDEAFYWLERYSNRIYDLVLNTRPERNFKRPHLANRVRRLAIIQGYNFRKDDYMDLSELNPKFLNESRLTPQEVIGIYNQSLVGGIFSDKEGACYSSSEFLLCGLPVVSTASEGGRDVWYNKWNSIICEATEEGVAHAVSEAIRRLETGEFSRSRIRSMHISLQYLMRGSFCRFIAGLCGISDAQSIRLFSGHLASTNKLQHKVKMRMVPAYIEASL